MGRLNRHARGVETSDEEESDEDAPKHFLISAVDYSGDDFMLALLKTTEFSAPVLNTLGGRGPKEHAADTVSELYRLGRLSASDVLHAMARRARIWLAFRHGTAGHIQTKQPIEEFFARFQAQGWFGPVSDGATSWFVYVKHIKHFVDSETPTRLRWHIVAEVRPDLIALHWANFDVRSQTSPDGLEEFAYWHHVPDIMTELATIASFQGAWPDLNILILHNALKTFESLPACTWDHQKIRAEQDSVAINASGSRKRSRGSGGAVSLNGIRALTRKLAEAAVEELGADPTRIVTVENRILKTFLYEWGTKSYEFALTGDGHDYRMHAYFGSHPSVRGPDSFPHVRSWIQKGGGRASLDFLLRHLP